MNNHEIKKNYQKGKGSKMENGRTTLYLNHI